MRTVIFDFDGTLTTGDDIARRYALEASQAVAYDECDAYESEVAAGFRGVGLQRWNAGLDGFDMVHRCARDHHAPEDALNRAYLRSREAIATGEVEINAPDGLSTFLHRLQAHKILVTNSPKVGIGQALTRMDIANCIDAIYTSVGKPEGLTPILQSACEEEGPQGVLCVGDIWENDLLPAFALGCSTALISHGKPSSQPATFIADKLTELYPAILAWVRQASHDQDDLTTDTQPTTFTTRLPSSSHSSAL